MAARALAEAQVEADQIVELTRNALAVDGDLLSVTERAAIDAVLAGVSARRAGTDAASLRAAIETLNRATTEFAGRRMDRSVTHALSGKRIDTVV
jgi:molecular chaperone HscA